MVIINIVSLHKKNFLNFIFFFYFVIKIMSQPANLHQIKLLVSSMKENAELAQSYNKSSCRGRERNKMLWLELKTKLNNLGPPIKTVAEWKRVWTLRKYRTKKKIMKKKTHESTCRNSPTHVCNQTENDIAEACDLQATVSGIPGVQTFGSSFLEVEFLNDSFELNEEPVATENNTTEDVETTTQPQNVRLTKTAFYKKQNELLEKHIKYQQDFALKVVNTLNEIKNALVENTSITAELKKNEIEHQNEILRVKRMELEIQKTANELKQAQLNIQMHQ